MNKNTSNILWMLIEKGILLIVELLVVTQIAKQLGVEDFGLLTLCLTVIAVLQPLFNFGLQSLVVKECIENSDSKRNQKILLSNAIFLKLSITLIFLLSLTFYHLTFEQNNEFLGYIICLLVAELFRSMVTLNSWFESRLESKYNTITRVLAVSIASILKMVAIYNQSSIDIYIYIYSFEIFMWGCLAYLFFNVKSGLNVKFGFVDKDKIKELIKNGSPLVLSAFGAIIYIKSDVFIIGYLMDNHSVGIYSAATRFVEVLYVLPVIIVSSYFPNIIGHRGKDTEEKFTRNFLSILFYIGSSFSMLLVLLAPFLVDFLLGSAFVQSKTVLIYYSLTLPLVFLRAFLSKWIISQGFYSVSLYTQLCGAISNIVINFILIPIWGLNGAIVATGLSMLMASVFSLYFLEKTRIMFKYIVCSPLYMLSRD
ncbi:flippase [Vibrio crassostreae]|uniref:flippase n=1 Tax=Vibrio crassostreae TaxID=246167 RepID=UPI000F507D38|nr:flippase [Vibrio crassostreae]RPF00122.1 O-antigen/teichoic acid export membrane protein [Vibrio crassostreae]